MGNWREESAPHLLQMISADILDVYRINPKYPRIIHASQSITCNYVVCVRCRANLAMKSLNTIRR